MQQQTILRHRIQQVRMHLWIRARPTQLKSALSEDNMALMGGFALMLQVLRQLNYVDEDRTVLLKGRVACEVACRHVEAAALAHSLIRSTPAIR